jgi:hypothetical protein
VCRTGLDLGIVFVAGLVFMLPLFVVLHHFVADPDLVLFVALVVGFSIVLPFDKWLKERNGKVQPLT